MLVIKLYGTLAGKYGKLNAKDITGVRTLTLYDDNSAYYECLDKDTKEGTETITARVYIKAKAAPESEYKLFDEITGTIKINNDPKKKIIHVPLTLLHVDQLSGTTHWCYKAAVASVPEEKDAASYFLRFYTPVVIGAPQSASWTPTNHSFYGPHAGPAKYQNGVFTVLWAWSSVSSSTWNLTHASGSAANGVAEVVITLK